MQQCAPKKATSHNKRARVQFEVEDDNTLIQSSLCMMFANTKKNTGYCAELLPWSRGLNCSLLRRRIDFSTTPHVSKQVLMTHSHELLHRKIGRKDCVHNTIAQNHAWPTSAVSTITSPNRCALALAPFFDSFGVFCRHDGLGT